MDTGCELLFDDEVVGGAESNVGDDECSVRVWATHAIYDDDDGASVDHDEAIVVNVAGVAAIVIGRTVWHALVGIAILVINRRIYSHVHD